MSRAETLAGLAEVLGAHWVLASTKDYDICVCKERIPRGVDPWAHVAAVALAWLEGHRWAEERELLRRVQHLIESERRYCYEQQEVRRVWVNAWERMNVLHTIITDRIKAWAPVETGEKL